MPTEPSTHGHLLELTPDACWDLAASRPVGRLAWAGPSGPTVVPVNFAVDGNSVLVRTKAYSAAARECDDSVVAFEVDDIDVEGRTGWSVLMRGRAHIDFYASTRGHDPDAWPEGSRALRLRVEVGEITGRRIGAVA